MEIIIVADRKKDGFKKIARKVKANYRIGGNKDDILKLYGSIKAQIDQFNGMGEKDIGWINVVDVVEEVGEVQDW